MPLIVDAEVVFASLIKVGFTFDLIRYLNKVGIKLMSPQYLEEELFKRFNRILKYSGLTPKELEFIISILFKHIIITPKLSYEPFLQEARKLSPHDKDAPYFALALASDSPLWSNEKKFKEQSIVKILSTSDLKEMLKL